ncbi:MAG: tetratricopeptide repeat protein [Rhodocyclaceae bacterium]|nr:tetratricopeptide repeat protein [Rhodocyclaceae bacterium]
MSLLNKMLRDLDARRAGESERKGLPRDLRPLPPPQNRARLLPGLLVAAALIVAGGYWAMTRIGAPAPAAFIPPSPPRAMPEAAPPAAPDAVAPMLSAAENPPKLRLDPQLAAKPPAAVEPKPDKPKALPTLAAESATLLPKAAAHSSPKVEKRVAGESPLTQAENEFHRAQGLLAQGQRAEGEAALRQALVLSGLHAAARQTLFALLVEDRRIDEARATIEEGLQVSPAQTVWAMNLARLLMERGDNAAALDILQKTLPYARQNAEFRAFCGTVLQRLNRAQEASEHFQAALRINPSEGRWWLGLALALETVGHAAESREAYARAKSVGNLPADLAAYAERKSH